MNKRLLALILICALFLLPVTAETTARIAVSDIQAQPEQTVLVGVTFQNKPQIAGFVLEIAYDHSALEFTDVSLAHPEQQPQGELTFNPETNQFSWTGAQNIVSGTGPWCYLHFTVRPGVGPGSYPISLQIKDNEPTNLVNAAGAGVPAIFSAGSVVIPSEQWHLDAQVTTQANKADVSVQVTNYDLNAPPAVVYLAGYDRNGKLLQLHVVPVTLVNGAASATLQLSPVPTTVKCMLLDQTTHKPLTEAFVWPK